LYLFVIVYNSIVPLDFSALSVEIPRPSPGFIGVPVVPISIPDAASNVAFYVPLGVLLCATLAKLGWGRWLAVVPTTAFAAILSYLMELLQTALHTRIATAYDCFFNLAGAIAGAVVSGPIVLLVRESARDFARGFRDRPSLVLINVLGLGLFALALLPVDVTFSVDRLRTAVMTAHWIPFEKLGEIGLGVRAAEHTLGPAARAVLLREWWTLALDYATWSILYAIFALSACYYLRVHCRMGRVRAAAHAVGLCGVYSLISSALQVFVISRGLDGTVPVYQMFGAVCGVLLQPLVVPRGLGPGRRREPITPQKATEFVRAALVAVCVSIALRQLVPLRFDISAQSLAAQWALADWLPLGTYQSARFHVAVNDIVHKMARFATLGALLAAGSLLTGSGAAARRPWRVGLWAGLAIAATEVLQLAIPSRIPGVTDILLAALGTTAGVYVHNLAALWFHEARGRTGTPGPAQIDYRVDLGESTDPAAPREQEPGKRPPWRSAR
jgi:VanZ family protein